MRSGLARFRVGWLATAPGSADLNLDEAGVCTLRAPDEPATAERPNNWIVVSDD